MERSLQISNVIVKGDDIRNIAEAMGESVEAMRCEDPSTVATYSVETCDGKDSYGTRPEFFAQQSVLSGKKIRSIEMVAFSESTRRDVRIRLDTDTKSTGWNGIRVSGPDGEWLDAVAEKFGHAIERLTHLSGLSGLQLKNLRILFTCAFTGLVLLLFNLFDERLRDYFVRIEQLVVSDDPVLVIERRPLFFIIHIGVAIALALWPAKSLTDWLNRLRPSIILLPETDNQIGYRWQNTIVWSLITMSAIVIILTYVTWRDYLIFWLGI